MRKKISIIIIIIISARIYYRFGPTEFCDHQISNNTVRFRPLAVVRLGISVIHSVPEAETLR